MSVLGPPRARVFVRWAIARGPWLWLAALLVFVPSAARTASLYRRLSSDLEQLLPQDSPSVLALQELRRRMPGLQHLGLLVDHGSPANAAAAERLVDDLAARVRRYPPNLVRRVQTDVTEERRFFEATAPCTSRARTGGDPAAASRRARASSSRATRASCSTTRSRLRSSSRHPAEVLGAHGLGSTRLRAIASRAPRSVPACC
jgi:hypothetical protein